MSTIAQRPQVDTLVELAYHRIHEDILAGKLRSGQKLRIEPLRKTYEVGASPLREALNRLVGRGLVTAVGQRGFKVSSVSKEDLDDITNVRILIECEALRQSIENGDDDWEAEIVAAFHRIEKTQSLDRGDFTEWNRLNREFHLSLISRCSSKWLIQFRDILDVQMQRYKALSLYQYNPNRNIRAEHRAIKNAVLRRDIKAACSETSKHIRRTRDNVQLPAEDIAAKQAVGFAAPSSLNYSSR